ncbi:hypothetical protein GCM10023163_08870 [Aestuariibaculum suncheonense]
MSSVPDSSRWEIVQSQQGVRYTFKIDKYIGRVYQLVMGENGETWQPIPFEGLIETYISGLEYRRIETGEEVLPEDMLKPSWQLFTSGHGIKYTFLLNIHSGITLKLFVDTETEELFWKKIE